MDGAGGTQWGEGPVYDSFKLVNPVSITRTDASGRVVDQIQAVRESTDGPLCASNVFPQSTWVRWTHNIYDDGGDLIASRAYHTIPACGAGSPGTHYDETIYGYSAEGRRNRERTPGGTITRTTTDAAGRTTGTWVGTNDEGATDERPDGAGPFPASLGPAFWGSAESGLFQDAAGTTPVTADAQPVGRWNDRRGGVPLYFSQTNTSRRPTFQMEGVNGRRSVGFSAASSQFLRTCAPALPSSRGRSHVITGDRHLSSLTNSVGRRCCDGPRSDDGRTRARLGRSSHSYSQKPASFDGIFTGESSDHHVRSARR